MPDSSMSRAFTDSLALRKVSETVFETIHNPKRIGNSLNIAYGGYALAVAVKASAASVPSNYNLYSILGNYLGPALTDRPLLARVRNVRQTRTFSTRQIEISQKQADGTERPCLIALADFQVPEKASVMDFDVRPSKNYSSYEVLVDWQTHDQKMVETGKVSQDLADMHMKTLGVLHDLYEQRPCPEGIFPHNLTGMAKTLPTPQSDLPLPERSTADWVRSKEPLTSQMENVACLAFYMDAALSFCSLSFSGMFLDDVGACSSLDFALRIFRNEVDMAKWHLREIQTRVGGEGKTYNEARIWDEHGKCVGIMTQANIMRPKIKREGGNL
jgi:acyl-CoA thioesterase II